MLNNRFGFGAFNFSGTTMSNFSGVIAAASCGISAFKFRSFNMSINQSDSPISLTVDLSRKVCPS